MRRGHYSIADKTGHIRFDNKNVYRVITGENSDEWWNKVGLIMLCDDTYLHRLFKAGLVSFDFIGNAIRINHEFPKMLKMEYIYSFSHLHHLLKRQLVDMLKMVCNLNLVLRERKLTTSNWHEGDITLKGCSPRFVDLGGIAILNRDSAMYNFFRMMYIIGKYLVGNKYDRTHEYYNHKWVQESDPSVFYHIKEMVEKNKLIDYHERFLKEMLDYLYNYKFHEKETWCEYQDNFYDIEERIKKEDLNPKEYAIWLLENRLKYGNETLFDVGGNKGMSSMMGALFGYKCFSLDSSENSTSVGYQYCKNHPIFFDKIHYLCAPFEDIFKQYEECQSLIDRTPACNRYKSDVVLCSAFMHHWKDKLSLLAHYLSELTLKMLVFEFIPAHVTLKNVIDLFKNYDFHLVDQMDSNVEGRKFLMFNRHQNYSKLE